MLHVKLKMNRKPQFRTFPLFHHKLEVILIQITTFKFSAGESAGESLEKPLRVVPIYL